MRWASKYLMSSPLITLKNMNTLEGVQLFVHRNQDKTLISLDELAQLREALGNNQYAAKFVIDKRIDDIERQLDNWGEDND